MGDIEWGGHRRRFIFAYLQSEEAVETCIQILRLEILGSHPGAASNELPDLGQVTVFFQVLDFRFSCHTDEH